MASWLLYMDYTNTEKKPSAFSHFNAAERPPSLQEAVQLDESAWLDTTILVMQEDNFFRSDVEIFD